jgi:DNA modification methylase
MTIPFMTTFQEAGFHFAQNCIWNKQQFVMTRKDYHYKHEPVMYGWKKGAAHSWQADRKQSSVWNFDRPFKNELHPTMKPIELLEYPLKNSSAVGSNVLDLFGGSGSTLIACEKTNRKCFMMELDPHYCDVILSRWEKYTGKNAALFPN